MAFGAGIELRSKSIAVVKGSDYGLISFSSQAQLVFFGRRNTCLSVRFEMWSFTLFEDVPCLDIDLDK